MQKKDLRPITYTPGELIASLKVGDHKAFGSLYDNYNKALFTVIKRMINDDDDAADILQDVFINIYKKIGTYDPSKGKLFTWMLNISVNASIDRVRSSRYRHSRETCSLNELTVSHIRTIAPSPEKINMGSTLRSLSSMHRDLIHLSFYEGYTHGQISKMQGVPIGTIKSRIRSALRSLRQLIEAEEELTESPFALSV